MNRFAVACSSITIVAALVQPLTAQTSGAGRDTDRPGACTILTRAEVKKHMPWPDMMDSLEETEEPWGTGTYCSYPGVTIWLGRYSASVIESARKLGPLTPAPDVAPEAFFHAQGRSEAGLYIRLGDRLAHIETPLGFVETLDSVQPKLVALGKALVAKLR